MNQTKQCTKCHMEKELTEFSKDKASKDGLKAQCKACDKQYKQANKEHNAAREKQWREANAEYIAAREKQWREANAEHSKQYRQDNAEHISATHKQWALNNAEHRAEYHKKWREDNPEYDKQWNLDNAEHIAARMKQYRQTPTGKAAIKASRQNRRAATLNNGGKHTAKEILALFDQQSGKCAYGKTKLAKTGKNKYHVDHIVPLSKGGTNDISNIQLLCPKCNLTKHNKSPNDYAAKFGKLF